MSEGSKSSSMSNAFGGTQSFVVLGCYTEKLFEIKLWLFSLSLSLSLLPCYCWLSSLCCCCLCVYTAAGRAEQDHRLRITPMWSLAGVGGTGVVLGVGSGGRCLSVCPRDRSLLAFFFGSARPKQRRRRRFGRISLHVWTCSRKSISAHVQEHIYYIYNIYTCLCVCVCVHVGHMACT